MSLDYIRRYYSVPACRGATVEFDYGGQVRVGRITGASGPHLLVRFEGARDSVPLHPTWQVAYQQEDQP